MSVIINKMIAARQLKFVTLYETPVNKTYFTDSEERITLAQDRGKCWALVNAVMNIRVPLNALCFFIV
jgi:hypothetical protein